MASPYAAIGHVGAPAPAPKSGGIFGKVGGFLGNLGHDIKVSALGFPQGLVQLAEHPIRAGSNIAKTTWQTWSPLFHGHFKQFGHQTYDHPLAPLLDLATVFSLGTSAAANAAKLGELDAGLGGKLADLARPKTIKLTDPTEAGRPAFNKALSSSPGWRLVQEGLRAAEPHTPQWLSGGLKKASYEKAHVSDVVHRAMAKSMIVASALKAGKALEDARPRQEIAAGMYLNLLRHGHRMSEADAAAALKGGHYGVVIDARKLDPQMRLAHYRNTQTIDRLQGRIERLHALREKHAEAAHSLPSLHDALDAQNQMLADMRANGHVVATPARKLPGEPTPRQLMENQAKPLVEIQKNIAQLEKMREKARVSQKIHDNAIQKINETSQLIDKHTAAKAAYEQRSFADYFRKAGESHQSFEDFANNLGRNVVRGGSQGIAKKLEAAARDQKGNVIVVPMHDAKNLGREAVNSSRMLRWLVQKPTRIWKMALLGYSPRVVINNGVGNWLLYSLRSDNPAVAIRGIRDGIAAVHGAKVADTSLKHAVPFERNHWLYRHFGDEINGNTFARELGQGKLRQGFYPLVHKLADQPVRTASIMGTLRKAPEVRAYMDRGLPFEKAAQRALRSNRELRDRVVAKSRTVAGDYVALNPVEQQIRNIVPFYLWDRHILKSTGHLISEQPGRVALAAAVGKNGTDKTLSQLGDIPTYMYGLIPFGHHPKVGQRGEALSTQGFNPFSTIPDLFDTAQALLTGGKGAKAGESIGGQINPLATSLIEQLSGHNLLTDSTNIPHHGGVVPSVFANTAATLPGVQLIQKALGGGKKPSPNTLYAHTPDEIVASLAGIPIKRPNLTEAHSLAVEERTGKRSSSRPSHHKTSPYSALGR